MNAKKFAVAMLAVLSAPAFGQTIYKCPSATQGDPPIIQQSACRPGSGGEKMVVNAPKAAGQGGLRESEVKALIRGDKRGRDLMVRKLEKDISQLESKRTIPAE